MSVRDELNKLKYKLAEELYVEHVTCEDVTAKEAAKYMKKVVPVMEEILNIQGGVGLAAPQIGIAKNFFILKNGDKYDVIFNASYIVKKKGTLEGVEGCLSYDLGKRYTKIKRNKFITVTYDSFLDKELFKVTENPRELRCRAFQHEIDHLTGKTIFGGKGV